MNGGLRVGKVGEQQGGTTGVNVGKHVPKYGGGGGSRAIVKHENESASRYSNGGI